MKIRIVLFIVLQLALSLRCLAVKVETTDNLVVFYLEFSKIDLVCGQMPKTTEKNVEFCCEAAFTGELLIDFKHLNIADNHICNGEMKRGYKCSLPLLFIPLTCQTLRAGQGKLFPSAGRKFSLGREKKKGAMETEIQNTVFIWRRTPYPFQEGGEGLLYLI